MPDQPLVIVSEHLSAEALNWLAQRCRVERTDAGELSSHPALADAQALIVRTYSIVDEPLLTKMTNLKVVGRAGVGLDNIDVDACRRRKINVINTPDANTQAVLEYVFALMLDALRPRTALTQPVDMSSWNQLRSDHIGDRELSELTLGILGFGRIGRRVAQVAAAFGMNVIYNDLLEIHPARRSGAQPVTANQLFKHSDIITVHIDGRSSNRHFVCGRLLNRMQTDVVFVNTSRGFVVDHAALLTFMQQNPAALALLDVHDPEPPEEGALWDLENMRLYPHLASRTQRAMDNMSWVVREVWRALQ